MVQAGEEEEEQEEEEEEINVQQCRRKADLDFLAFCVSEETTRTTADDLDEDGADRP